MPEIRPLEPGDLEAVAQLVTTCIPGWRRSASVLASNLVAHPWAASQLRSLVVTDGNGTIVGAFGAQERRLIFNGEQIRGVCCSHLVVDPERRAGAAGAMLVKQLLAGDQDLTWTDSGTAPVVRIWHAFGGHLDHSRTADWMYVLRPARWMRHALADFARRRRGRHVIPAGGLPVQALGSRLVPRAFPAPPEGLDSEEATPALISEHLPRLTAGVRLRIAYDREYLEHVFAQVESLATPVVHRLVRQHGEPIGWYALLPRPTVSRVIHIAADSRRVDAVFAQLVADARDLGCSLISGRFEPHLDEPLRERLGVLGLAQRPLIHARDPELLAAVGSSASLLTELDLVDSEWW